MPANPTSFSSWPVALWLVLYSALARAANASLFEDVIGYDFASLYIAFACGLMGGAGRTLITLCTRTRLVGNVRFVLLKDMVVALIGGGFTYLLIQGYNSLVSGMTLVSLPPVISDLRVALIVIAGASRGRWLGAIDRAASDVLDNVRLRLRGNIEDPPRDPPSSVASPLGE